MFSQICVIPSWKVIHRRNHTRNNKLVHLYTLYYLLYIGQVWSFYFRLCKNTNMSMFLMALPGHGWGTQQKHHGWFGFRMLRPGHFLDFKHILSIQLKIGVHHFDPYDLGIWRSIVGHFDRRFKKMLPIFVDPYRKGPHSYNLYKWFCNPIELVRHIYHHHLPSNPPYQIGKQPIYHYFLMFFFLNLFLGVTITLCHYTFQLRKSVSPGLRLRSEVGLQRWMARLLRGNMGKIWRFP